MRIAIDKLQPHPQNEKIYGDGNVDDLTRNIQTFGWKIGSKLLVTESLVIVGGHRRWKAAKQLGFTEIPVDEDFVPEDLAEQTLLEDNEGRIKTNEQKARECMAWEPIEVAKAKQRQDTGGNSHAVRKIFSEAQNGRVREILGSHVGWSGPTCEKAMEAVEYMDAMAATGNTKDASAIRMTLNGEKDDGGSVHGAYNLVKKFMKADEDAEQRRKDGELEALRKQDKARQRYLDVVARAEHCTLYHCSVAELSQYVHPESVDCIITDPPYPGEFLPVYSDLADFASYALRPGGSLLVMVGQSYLQEVMQRLGSTGLVYQWTCAYLTPGNATQVHARHVQNNWKPLLWFVKGEYEGMYVYDTFRSDAGDKSKHNWGQSESGIGSIMERFSKVDDFVCDPFVGGGTTAIVAVDMQRRFVGCDIDETCIGVLEGLLYANEEEDRQT